jgi:hypothetical protein
MAKDIVKQDHEFLIFGIYTAIRYGTGQYGSARLNPALERATAGSVPDCES